MKLNLSDRSPVDLEALVDTRLLIQANSGGGKSWALRRLLEQSHGRIQHLIIDPEGEFATLREKFDYVLAARRGGDTAAEPRIAGLLAERLLELQASAILDIYELPKHDRIRFVRAFLEALVDAPKKLWHPVLVVIDEAHVFCPQQEEAESGAAVIDLATRGRKRGFCPILATQRLSKLHKDAAAECNNVLIGRTGLDVDVKRAADQLGFGKERWRELRELPAGRFFGFGPALSREVAVVEIGPVQTTHPKAGSRIAAAPPPPRDKVKALLPRLADLPAEVEERQKTLDDLKREAQQLRRDLAAAKKAAPPAPPTPAPQRFEIPVLTAKQIDRLEKLALQIATAGAEATSTVQVLEASIRQVMSFVPFSSLKMDAKTFAAAVKQTSGKIEVRRPPLEKGAVQRAPVPARSAAAALARRAEAGPGHEGVSNSQQRILDSLAWLDGLGLTPADKSQVALLADQSPTSGGYFNNLGRLRSQGLIEYPAGGTVELTDEGRGAARASDVPTTDAALHAQLFQKLPAPQARILEALIARYPDPIPKAELAAETGQSPTSGGYFNNLGRLRSLRLIDYPTPGHAVATRILFVEGRA